MRQHNDLIYYWSELRDRTGVSLSKLDDFDWIGHKEWGSPYLVDIFTNLHSFDSKFFWTNHSFILHKTESFQFLRSFPLSWDNRYNRVVQDARLPVLTSWEISWTAAIDVCLDVTVSTSLVEQIRSTHSNPVGCGLGYQGGQSSLPTTNVKLVAHHSCNFAWMCGLAPSVWQVQSLSDLKATGHTFLMYRPGSTAPSEKTRGKA